MTTVNSDTAPTLAALGITQEEVDAVELTTKEPPSMVEGDADAAKAIIAEFADIEAANGLLDIAQRNKVSKAWTQILYNEWQAARTIEEV